MTFKELVEQTLQEVSFGKKFAVKVAQVTNRQSSRRFGRFLKASQKKADRMPGSGFDKF